jgi:hypothetical protein
VVVVLGVMGVEVLVNVECNVDDAGVVECNDALDGTSAVVLMLDVAIVGVATGAGVDVIVGVAVAVADVAFKVSAVINRDVLYEVDDNGLEVVLDIKGNLSVDLSDATVDISASF